MGGTAHSTGVQVWWEARGEAVALCSLGTHLGWVDSTQHQCAGAVGGTGCDSPSSTLSLCWVSQFSSITELIIATVQTRSQVSKILPSLLSLDVKSLVKFSKMKSLACPECPQY